MSMELNKALDLLREIRPSIPKEVLELWCKDRDAFLASHSAVEQAGGDERAEFERAFTVQEGIYFDDKRGEYRSMNLCAIEASDAQDLNLQLQGWQARAALAQRSEFHQHLKECADEVATWPSYKREALTQPSIFHRPSWPTEELEKHEPALAQHSVPEGWMLVECGIWTQEQVDEMQKTVARFRNSEFVDDRALAMAVADAGQCKAPEISLAELLAGAPGKEGV
ncbi:hypothetical protein ISE64_07230 [Pseudomonas aeruginosa]|nr:hypothetical protein [Pseudomonas aeruginosa]